MRRFPVVVLGGGISGLAFARKFRELGRTCQVFEASDRLGGNVRTETHDGFLYDVGPDSFLKTRPEAHELAISLGLESELMAPREGGTAVSVAYEGRLLPMPEGLSLGVPTRLGALLESDLLSDVGKARALLEPFVPRRRTSGEESIEGFLTRRLGAEMATRIAAPLLSGVFAGDAKKLSIDSAFPGLVELERRHGSLSSGMLGGKPFWYALGAARKKHESPFLSFATGLGRLVEALAATLPEETISRGVAAEDVELGHDVVRVRLGDEWIETGHLVVTGAPWFAARLLERALPDVGALLAEVRGAPTATVFFGLDESSLERPFEGSGFIVPEGEGEILAATLTSSKWRGRAPRGAALVRAFVGGARGRGLAGETTDDALVASSYRELTRFLGHLGEPRFARVFRYERGSPQLELGHDERLARLRAELARVPRLSLTGPGYGGVGIPDCIRGAHRLAESLANAT